LECHLHDPAPPYFFSFAWSFLSLCSLLSKERTLLLYKKKLEEAGITTTIRYSRGKDIDAACGQLANKQ